MPVPPGSTPTAKDILGPHVRASNPHAQYATLTQLAAAISGLTTSGIGVQLSSAIPQAESVGVSGLAGTGLTASRSDHRHAMPSTASGTADGFMSASDKAKLDSITVATLGTVTNVTGEGGVVTVLTGTTTPAISLTTNGVANIKLAQMATKTVKGNNTVGTANAADLTMAQFAGMWGTPTGSKFLRDDGTLAVPAGAGTVTSVALTLPAELTVSGSPVMTSGTLAAVWASQTQNKILASPNGSSGTPAFRALVAGDLPAGTGTATSVGLSLPGIFTISGSPVTTSGTLTAVLATQTANTIWAGPTIGAAAAPTFRAAVAADIPNLPASIITSGQLATTQGGTGLDTSAATNGKVLIGNGSGLTLATITAGSGIVITNGSGTISIAASAAGAPFSDATDLVMNGSDNTKTVLIAASALTTGKRLTIGTGAQTASRTITVPVLTTSDIFAVQGADNNFTSTQTLTGSGNTTLQITGTGTGIPCVNIENTHGVGDTAYLRILGGTSGGSGIGFRGTLTMGTIATNTDAPTAYYTFTSTRQNINTNNASTSIVTGSLVVGTSSGGLGVAGQIWAGQHIISNRGFGSARAETASSGSTITLGDTDKTIQVITGTTAQTITLPSTVWQGAGTNVGQFFFIKNRTNQTATINSTGSGTIDGLSSYSLPAGTGALFIGPIVANGDWVVF